MMTRSIQASILATLLLASLACCGAPEYQQASPFAFETQPTAVPTATPTPDTRYIPQPWVPQCVYGHDCEVGQPLDGGQHE